MGVGVESQGVGVGVETLRVGVGVETPVGDGSGSESGSESGKFWEWEWELKVGSGIQPCRAVTRHFLKQYHHSLMNFASMS